MKSGSLSRVPFSNSPKRKKRLPDPALSLVFMTYEEALTRVNARAVNPKTLLVVDMSLSTWLSELLRVECN
jgi:hypothetical protein